MPTRLTEPHVGVLAPLTNRNETHPNGPCLSRYARQSQMADGAEQHKHAGGMKIFVIIWFRQLVSTLGSGLTGFGLSVWIFDTTGSATLFAITLLIWMLPNVALSPVAGMLADR